MHINLNYVHKPILCRHNIGLCNIILYYVDIFIVYVHNSSLCAHNPSLCNIILYYVIFVQMAFHSRKAKMYARMLVVVVRRFRHILPGESKKWGI